jgi:2-iminobutanoate/2-iminopropanoate deaminase
MSRINIHTGQAPVAIGPYSQAVRVGNFVFTSGQIALDPQTGEMRSGDIEQETERVLESLQVILTAAGLSLGQVVKTTVYLVDLSHFGRMNTVYESFFKDNKPARSCVQVAALPRGALVEIDAVAAVNP